MGVADSPSLSANLLLTNTSGAEDGKYTRLYPRSHKSADNIMYEQCSPISAAVTKVAHPSAHPKLWQQPRVFSIIHRGQVSNIILPKTSIRSASLSGLFLIER